MRALARRILGTVARVKLVIAAGVGCLLLLVALMLIRQGGAAVLMASEGADARTAFRKSLTAPIEIRGAISWLPDRSYEGRKMEPQTRSDIADAYAQAWSAIDRASQGDIEAPVGEYLAGPALSHVRMQLAERAIRSTSVQTTHVGHKLELTFYSDDGSVVSLNAPEVTVERLVETNLNPDQRPEATVVTTSSTTSTTSSIPQSTIADGVTQTVSRTVEAYRLVMVLRDGNWRIELIERVAPGEVLPATEWMVTTTIAERPTTQSRPTTTTVRQIDGTTKIKQSTTTTTLSTARREWPQ